MSRPGCRVYVGQNEIPRVLGGLGINILTTPRGVMTGRDAHKEGVGGEIPVPRSGKRVASGRVLEGLDNVESWKKTDPAAERA